MFLAVNKIEGARVRGRVGTRYVLCASELPSLLGRAGERLLLTP